MKSRTISLAGLAASMIVCGCGQPASPVRTAEQSQHSWNSYHWNTSKSEISVKDKTAPVWDIASRLDDWNAANVPRLALSTARKTDVEVVVGGCGQCLGLAQIWLESDGHISRGKVTLWSGMLDPPYTATAIAHVACQEIGHVLGLDHIEGNTCMDDCAWAEDFDTWIACINSSAKDSPDAHDLSQLNDQYNHEDADSGGDSSGGGPPCSKNPDHPNCQPAGRWITLHVFPRP